jgi:hypothetical protein
MFDAERIGGGGRVFYDVISRDIAARDRIESMRRDFQAPPGVIQAAIGRRLVRLGLRLQGVELSAWPVLRSRASADASSTLPRARTSS